MKLTELFPDGVPSGFAEKQLDKAYEISVPWTGKALGVLNDAAGIQKRLDGTFTSPHGAGYCIGDSANDRVRYHFTAQP